MAFTSQYPIDKIAQTIEGSFTIGAYSGTTIATSSTVNHDQGVKCLPEMIWSRDEVNWYDSGFEDADFVSAVAACDTNTATIYAYNDSVGSTVTIYYTLYLLWPN